MSYLENLKKDLRKFQKPGRAIHESKFFKTGREEYGEGDIFWGVKTADMRNVAKKYHALSFADLQKLLDSPIHVFRSVALVILVNQYQKAKDEKIKDIVAKFCLKNTQNINNWDLVDISAPKILGDYFFERDRSVLYQFAKSQNLWARRISVISTFGFIRKNQFEDTLKIAEILVDDKEDLIQKAVGWMLREIGNRDIGTEEKFLRKYCRQMPRTMLRYAIEKFPEEKRKKYLRGEI